MDPSLYRTAWRWHFFAGLAVLPFLLWLAVTGGLYLFKPEIERAVYAEWLTPGGAAAPLPVTELVRRVEAGTGMEVRVIARPAEIATSWRFTLAQGETRRMAFVDLGSGAVLGTTPDGGVVELIAELHSLAITGPVGNALIEIVAGWAVVLVVTGFYLWWPRQGPRAFALRGKADERRFWRDLHATIGSVAGLLILFLAVTGLFWSIVWGAQARSVIDRAGLGRPAPPAAAAAPGEHGGREDKHLSWSQQGLAMPASRVGDVGPDRALAAAQARGIVAPYTIVLPRAPGQPYQIAGANGRSSEARIVHVDAATAAVLQDLSAQDFGAGARVVDWSIAAHMGREFGTANRLLMLFAALAVIVLALSAPVLWWKRRVRGPLTMPPLPADPRQARGLIALMLVLGLVFPLTGLTMVAALAGEALVRRLRTPRPREAASASP